MSIKPRHRIAACLSTNRWKPRVVVEAKLGSITTHDAITYNQKAATHRDFWYVLIRAKKEPRFLHE